MFSSREIASGEDSNAPSATPPILRCRPLALFLVVSLGFVLFRDAGFLIWNDSSGTIVEKVETGPTLAVLAGFFEKVGVDGYRPLAQGFHFLSLSYLYRPGGPHWPQLLLVGAVYGALAVAVLGVARQFVVSEAMAYFVVLLVIASPPLAATSWVIMTGVQAFVPLLNCAALLCYWGYREENGASEVRGWPYARRQVNLGALMALMVAGPWYREFLGIVPILIGFLEWQRFRRTTWLMAFAGLGLLHAIFPTALVKALFFPELPLKSVLAFGNLAGAVDTRGVRWHAALHFLPLFPPLLYVVAIVGWILSALRGRVAAKPVLWVWFLAAFLPILRVFTEHIHFLYAMAPAAILLAGAIENLWLHVGTGGRRVLGLCAFLIAADQASNLVGVHRVNHATYGGMDVVANWLKANVPKDSVVISNVIHGEEIFWHSGEHFENYWTLGAGVNDAKRVIDDVAKLDGLLAAKPAREVYFLDVDFDYLPEKIQYHRHKFVHYTEHPRGDLKLIHRTRATYYFVDPLRHLVPRKYVPFLGAPDLVNDFYLGPPRSRPWFSYQVEAYYRIAQVERR